MPTGDSTTTRNDFEAALKHAVLVCIESLTSASSASALRWLNVLVSGTSSAASQAEIGASCVRMLLRISDELSSRSTPQAALLRSRFGLYGMPFEPELFDAELPTGLANVMRSSDIGAQHSQFNTSVLDLKKMCSTGNRTQCLIYFAIAL